MLINDLERKGLIKPPSWLASNTIFLTQMGSVAYGVATEDSDVDIYGTTVPPKRIVFPHLAGEVFGFGAKKERFEQFQQHHVVDPSADGGKGRMYDFTIFNIVKTFNLTMQNNPNCLDALFVPQFCILHITQAGNLMRENRHKFLHKGCYYKLKGYAYSQLHKMTTKDPKGKRQEIRKKYGYDVKFAMHTVRLLDECQQILATGDLDLQRNREQLKAIRRGDVSEEEIRQWASAKEKDLEKLYAESKLPYSPDEGKIKQLLLDCLEEHYGSLKDAFVNPNAEKIALQQIQEILDGLQNPASLLG